MSPCSSTTPHRRKVALQGEQVSHQVPGQKSHVPHPLPACQGLSQEHVLRALEVCVGAGGALLSTPFQGCGLLPISPLPVSQTGLNVASWRGRDRGFEGGSCGLLIREHKDRARCTSCPHHIKLNSPVSCGLKHPHTRVSQHLFLHLICPAVFVCPCVSGKRLPSK